MVGNQMTDILPGFSKKVAVIQQSLSLVFSKVREKQNGRQGDTVMP
jgi:hypothetical protein